MSAKFIRATVEIPVYDTSVDAKAQAEEWFMKHGITQVYVDEASIVENKPSLSASEYEAVEFMIESQGWTDIMIRRKSSMMFDLTIVGKRHGWGFQCWFPLALIEACDWTKPKFALISSYPEMALDGDWSAIRDSEPEKIWVMVGKAVRELGIW
jgi:hypothetical protein